MNPTGEGRWPPSQRRLVCLQLWETGFSLDLLHSQCHDVTAVNWCYKIKINKIIRIPGPLETFDYIFLVTSFLTYFQCIVFIRTDALCGLGSLRTRLKSKLAWGDAAKNCFNFSPQSPTQKHPLSVSVVSVTDFYSIILWGLLPEQRWAVFESAAADGLMWRLLLLYNPSMWHSQSEISHLTGPEQAAPHSCHHLMLQWNKETPSSCLNTLTEPWVQIRITSVSQSCRMKIHFLTNWLTSHVQSSSSFCSRVSYSGWMLNTWPLDKTHKRI